MFFYDLRGPRSNKIELEERFKRKIKSENCISSTVNSDDALG